MRAPDSVSCPNVIVPRIMRGLPVEAFVEVRSGIFAGDVVVKFLIDVREMGRVREVLSGLARSFGSTREARVRLRKLP